MKEPGETMQCPACDTPLTVHDLGRAVVEACTNGCHGVLLDHVELRDADEAHEQLGQRVLDLFSGPPKTQPDTERRYQCPRCDMPMMRRLFKPQIRVMIDCCPNCAGIWLDHGELDAIRGAEGDSAARNLAAARAVGKLFAVRLPAMALRPTER